MSSSSSINCSAPGPFSPPINNDITGIGVVVNYIATASLALLIILIYYFVAYQPSRNPFDTSDQGSLPFRPNPVDDIVLRVLRRWPTSLLRRFLGSHRMSPENSARLEKVLVKCILAMSDLQIVTGFSILISGLFQLENGLAAYQWLFIVELAWFSCLTHLSCLTLLRNHLSHHTSERLWRLFAMGALATLVTYGLFSTANTWFSSGDYNQGIPAICHLGISPRPPDSTGPSSVIWSSASLHFVSWAFWTNLVSVMLILIGFTSRVIRLYRTLSVNIFGRARLWVSARIRRILRVLFIWSSRDGCRGSLKRSLIYRPLLALFLTVRFIIDGWTSVLCEVGWLITAFIWGFLRLLYILDPENGPSGDLSKFLGGGRGDWSFGQVVAVILLAAPLITVIEYFGDSEYDKRVLSDGPPRTQTSIPALLDNDIEDPDNDWSRLSPTFGTATIYAVITCIFLLGVFFFFSIFHSRKSPLPEIVAHSASISWAFSGLYGAILFSLDIEVVLVKSKPWARYPLEFLNIGGFIASIIPFAITDVNGAKIWLQGYFAAAYILFALIHRVFEAVRKSESLPLMVS